MFANDVEAGVYSWDERANEVMARTLRERCGIEKVATLYMKAHEPQVLNAMLDRATADYVLIMHAGIEIMHDNFAQVMYDFMEETPDAGIISPNREGEPRQGGVPGHWWYDGTAGLFRRCDIRFDTDFVFSQWADLDVGLEYQHQGFTVWRDPRISVRYDFRPFGSRSAFYHSYAARNKLLLDTKWYGVGREEWRGVDVYNAGVPPEGQIPSIFDLAWYGEEELKVFADSVELELHWILTGAGRENSNLAWKNPVVLARGNR